MSWRVARSLETLREQVNARYPNRAKASDGTIGDKDHRNRTSDHNPHYLGHVVTALDITHDPDNGVDIDQLTDELAASRDGRIKYVIANRLILDSRPGNRPWQWVRYSGSNPHIKHLHLSVMPNDSADDPRPWDLPSLHNNQPPEDNDVSYDDARRAMVDVLWRERHGSRVPGAEARVSLADGIMQTDAYTYQLRRQVAGLQGAVESLSTAVAAQQGIDPAELRQVIEDAMRGVVDVRVSVDGGDA